jgi:uncharacterized protein YaaR (DUF327 family)
MASAPQHHRPHHHRARLFRRINEIDESLARPVEEGLEWDRRRAALLAEKERIRGLLRDWSTRK